METKIYKPKIDRLFWITSITALIITLPTVIISAIFEPITLFITAPVLLFVLYFLLTSLFGYIELREKTVFIKFGFILKREIEYTKIRGFATARKFYSDSMLSLKNAFLHVNIKYNTFDVISVSVEDNDGFVEDVKARIRSL